MFDFLCPKLSALSNNLAGSELRLDPIMISNTLSARTGRQLEIEERQVQRQSQREQVSTVRLFFFFFIEKVFFKSFSVET